MTPTVEASVPKKTLGHDGGGTGKTTVKLKVDLHRMLRTVASYHGKDLGDYIDELLRPAATKAWADMARKIRENS